RFIPADCFSAESADSFRAALVGGEISPPLFHAISCQFSFHYAFSTRASVARTLANISSLLRPGGVFFGTTVDSKELLRRKAAHGDTFGNEEYRIEFIPTPPDAKVDPEWTSMYRFTLEACVESEIEYVAHWDAFVELAQEHGLGVIESLPFQQYYEKYIADETQRDIWHKMMGEPMDAAEKADKLRAAQRAGAKGGCPGEAAPAGLLPSSPNLRPSSPALQPTSPKLQPSSPVLAATSPNAAPSSPVMAATSPNAAPSSPVLAATSPNAAPSSPAMAATSPNAAPSSPVLAATSPNAAPSSPVMAATSPNAAPSSPVMAAASPNAAPSSPVLAATSPNAAPSSPAVQPSSPSKVPSAADAARSDGRPDLNEYLTPAQQQGAFLYRTFAFVKKQ
ncbi:hypothetical protein DIPPA_23405, partial [Diplonema papillatum]